MLRIALVFLLSLAASAAGPTQVSLNVVSVQLTFTIDSELWKREESNVNDRYKAFALYRHVKDPTKTVRIGISKLAYLPKEEKPRALRDKDEIPKLFSMDGGIGNCSFGDLQGFIQTGKDETGDFIHFIVMEPVFGGIVYVFGRNVSAEEIIDILNSLKTKVTGGL